MAEMYSYMSERSSDKSGKHDSTRSILRNKKNCVTYERINKQSDERTNGRKISPFYRTSSPIGAAAQKVMVIYDVYMTYLTVLNILMIP